MHTRGSTQKAHLTIMANRRLTLPLGCLAAGTTVGSLWTRQQRNKEISSPIAPAAAPPVATAIVSNRDEPVELFDAVGNTPLLELKSVSRLTGCKIYGKAEFMNPCGSIKDRAARSLIQDAEANGSLQPGGTLIEATGGNTGVSLAMLANARGYKTIITMPDTTAPEKIELMKTIGADVRVLPAVPLSDKENHFCHVAARLSATVDGAVYPDQFENLASMRSHYKGTGPEIWRQTSGKLDGFVSAAGTSGTIGGCSKYLKEQNPSLKVWLIDPKEITSLTAFINSGKTTSFPKDGLEMVPIAPSGSTIVEGVGLPRVTPNLHEAVIDKGVSATNQEVVDMAYFLLRNDGIFVGPSAAMNVVGAVKMARALGPGHTIATILCDSGERYRSKLFNPDWLRQQKLTPRDFARDEEPSLAFVL
jgi:cysteine synthase